MSDFGLVVECCLWGQCAKNAKNNIELKMQSIQNSPSKKHRLILRAFAICILPAFIGLLKRVIEKVGALR